MAAAKKPGQQTGSAGDSGDEKGSDAKATAATESGQVPRPDDTSPAKARAADSGDEKGKDEPTESTGPMTGKSAPPESSYRPPPTIVNAEGGPLDPPADTPTQTDPEQGYNLSSTDHVYAEAGGRTIAGEDHVGLVDGDGNSIEGGSLFDDEDGAKTFVTASKRVYEEFYYANTTEKARRLLFVEGQRVPRAQAERLKASLESAPEPAATQGQ